MPEVRTVPVVSANPKDFVHALSAALGVSGPDAEWAFEQRIGHLTLSELQEVTYAVGSTPFDSSAQLSFERAMAKVAAAKADVTPPDAA